MAVMTKFSCYDCGHVFEVPYGSGRPMACPACISLNIHRASQEWCPGRRIRPDRRGCGGQRGFGRESR